MKARPGSYQETLEIGRRVGVHVSPGAQAVVAVDDAGRVRGGVLYDCWTPNSVSAHVYTDTPIAWRALRGAAFDYPFREGGRGVLLATIRASNAASVRAVRHLGMREAWRVVDGWEPGEDLLTFEMRREWLAQGAD